ncbi:hypothetical protein WP1_252 [Pseudomonas phage WP1]
MFPLSSRRISLFAPVLIVDVLILSSWPALDILRTRHRPGKQVYAVAEQRPVGVMIENEIAMVGSILVTILEKRNSAEAVDPMAG